MTIRQSLAVLFFSIFCLSANAQNDPHFTVKGVAIGISAPELIDQLMVTMPGLGAKEMMEEQSVKPYLMPPRKVGERGDVTSYALATVLEFYSNFDKNYKVNLSPDFLSLKLRREGQKDVRNALRLLVTDGTVSADVLPYDAPQMAGNLGDAKKYQISNYLQIFSEGSRRSQKVFEVQKALVRGNPVIAELTVPANFRTVKNIRFWTASDDADVTLPFVVVGYNLDLEAFEIQSSWGTSWGSDGYLWIDYDDFGEMAQNGYVMVPEK